MMEFIRNIVLVDADTDSSKIVKTRLMKASKKLYVHIVSDRLQFTELVSKIDMKAVFINGNIGKKDAFYLFRFFSTFKGKDNSDIPLFFTTDDYSLIQEVLNNFALEALEIIPAPVTHDDVVEKLLASTFGKIEIKKPAGATQVDKEFLNVFVMSTVKVIKEMGNNAVIKALRPILMSRLEYPLENGIAAKIVLSSAFFKGTFFVIFPVQTFLSFSGQVLGGPQLEINSENQDLASELANIIYGQAKRTFSEAGYNLDMAIPTIFKGEIKHSPVYLIPFEGQFGPFHVAIAPGLI